VNAGSLSTTNVDTDESTSQSDASTQVEEHLCDFHAPFGKAEKELSSGSCITAVALLTLSRDVATSHSVTDTDLEHYMLATAVLGTALHILGTDQIAIDILEVAADKTYDLGIQIPGCTLDDYVYVSIPKMHISADYPKQLGSAGFPCRMELRYSG
jgi:hypothetical protein